MHLPSFASLPFGKKKKEVATGVYKESPFRFVIGEENTPDTPIFTADGGLGLRMYNAFADVLGVYLRYRIQYMDSQDGYFSYEEFDMQKITHLVQLFGLRFKVDEITGMFYSNTKDEKNAFLYAMQSMLHAGEQVFYDTMRQRKEMKTDRVGLTKMQEALYELHVYYIMFVHNFRARVDWNIMGKALATNEEYLVLKSLRNIFIITDKGYAQPIWEDGLGQKTPRGYPILAFAKYVKEGDRRYATQNGANKESYEILFELWREQARNRWKNLSNLYKNGPVFKDLFNLITHEPGDGHQAFEAAKRRFENP